ncbi:hypothetical protein G17_00561 [Escherichia phage vB_EcoM_G17]|nr:hypothetical protein G17_00561 [Escherichia phage vB_EcoM_G17]
MCFSEYSSCFLKQKIPRRRTFSLYWSLPY